MIFIITILLLSLVEYFGDANFKFYARTKNKTNLILGIIFYGLVIKFLIQALKSSNVIYANGIWDGVSAVVETVLAYYLLHETLSSPLQWFGLVMIVAGILALHSGKIPF
jgi:multidrug transporter EmrE-like cation transporter